MSSVTLMNGVGSRTPFLTTRTVPPRSTTKTRVGSPGGAVTYSGEANVPSDVSATSGTSAAARSDEPRATKRAPNASTAKQRPAQRRRLVRAGEEPGTT